MSNQPFFCDYLSVYQSHAVPVGRYDSGVQITVDSDGSVSQKVTKPVLHKHEFVDEDGASYSTSLSIKVDAGLVSIRGNIGRYGRPDNVFGFSVDQCKRFANEFLRALGFPEFTESAKVTRVDLTVNYAAGSSEAGRAYIGYLGSVQTGRQLQHVYADGATIDIGRGSRYVYSKVYLKGPELYKRRKKTGVAMQVIDYCNDSGVVRYELELKQALARKNVTRWEDCTDERLAPIFQEYEDKQLRKNVEVAANTDELKKNERMTYIAWKGGEDTKTMMSQATWYRHRKEILRITGSDIAIKRKKDDVQVRVITLKPLPRPAWYQLDESVVIEALTKVDKVA